MTEIDYEKKKKILKKYSRFIVHMRKEISDKRFGLVLGAGVSKDLGFPVWEELVRRISSHQDIDAKDLIKEDNKNISISQLLYQKYKSKMKSRANEEESKYNRLEMKIRAGWHEIVHDALYKDVPENINELQKNSVYIQSFIDIIKESPITINYNFDDSLERLLAALRTPAEVSKSRGYKATWSANMRVDHETRIIYHPNGYLPLKIDENPSPQIIFLQDSFEDQLISSITGHYAFLVNHLAQTTCLLVGLSLEDPTLKNILRQNAIRNPGHYNYYIKYMDSTREDDNDYYKTISDLNFDVYNLITLFLNRQEIQALGVLLRMEPNDFMHIAEDIGEKTVFKFFITGSVAVGKTTVVSQFQSLKTYDEWLEPRPPGMETDPSKIDHSDIIKIDNWVADQVASKNLILLDKKEGIYIIDRTPLDAFAFTPREQWNEKACLLKSKISPGEFSRKLCPGHIIFLEGDPEVMAVRAVITHKRTNAKSLNEQQERLNEVYSEREGISRIDTKEKSVWQVTKEIAHIIFNKPYKEAPMQEMMDVFQMGVN